MQLFTRIGLCLLAVAMAAGCASTKVSDRHEYTGGKIPRPHHIWVYDFSSESADVPADSALAGKHAKHATPQTAEQIATGKRMGELIATQLVEEIFNGSSPHRVGDFGLITYRVEHAG